MLLLRRHPRFIILLSFFLTASLLLLLSHSPFAALQPTSRPLKPSAGFPDLTSRVQCAERAYQKMLLGRDALIAKVGPGPRNVALFVLFFSSALANAVAMAV